MSEPMQNTERDWRLYVDDMISFAEKVSLYTDGLDQERFVSSGLNYDATARNLELIGEAATRIPSDVREAAHHIPWRQIIATRNRPIHGYLGIDNDTLWSIHSGRGSAVVERPASTERVEQRELMLVTAA